MFFIYAHKSFFSGSAPFFNKIRRISIFRVKYEACIRADFSQACVIAEFKFVGIFSINKAKI